MTVLLKIRLSIFEKTIAFQILEQDTSFFIRHAGTFSNGSIREFRHPQTSSNGLIAMDDAEHGLTVDGILYIRGRGQKPNTHFKVAVLRLEHLEEAMTCMSKFRQAIRRLQELDPRTIYQEDLETDTYTLLGDRHELLGL